MKRIPNIIVLLFLLITMAACSNNDPGPLAGTWKMDGLVPMTLHFRNGESEAMGMIEKVSYEVNGNEVIVTSENGPMEGISVRYIVSSPNVVSTEFGKFRRIK